MIEPIDLSLDTLTNIAVCALEDIKGKNITLLDTDQQTALFQRLIVASGDSTRQVKALANEVYVKLKDNGLSNVKIEGEEVGEWVLVDADDLIIHVMLPAVRDYYDLEGLWGGEKPHFIAPTGKTWQAIA